MMEEEMEVEVDVRLGPGPVLRSSSNKSKRPQTLEVEEEEMKTRHLLEIIACATGEGRDQLISIVHQSVHDQLRNWGIDWETTGTRATRGRSKTRKNSGKGGTTCGGGGRNELGYNRLVDAKLRNWKVSVKVPILIKQTCDFLREHVKTEGIFRKSGSASRVQALMQRFASLEKHEELSFTASETVFDVATVLKQYLREMDSPLIPYDIHSLFRKCLEVPSESSREEAVLLCSCLLSESSIGILTYLMEFLMEVVESSLENRMSYENLAIVMGPNIMPVDTKKVDKTKELENERKFIEAHTKIVELLIRNGERLGCIPTELQKKIDGDIAARGSEDELEEGTQRRKKRRSGSLTRVLGFLRKVASKTGDTPVTQTPVDFNEFTHTPVIKSSKRRCLDENMFSLQKKKKILDGIRKNGLTVKDDDKRFSHITDTPNSIVGFITCPSPICLNPSPMKSDWKQTPSTTGPGRFKNLVTPSLLRRKEKNIADLLKSAPAATAPPPTTTPFSAPAKPFKARVGLGKKSKKQTPTATVLTDNNGNGSQSQAQHADVKRISSFQSIHKLAQSPRKVPVPITPHLNPVGRAASTRIPRPDKVIPVRKSNSSCRFPTTSNSPREGRILDTPSGPTRTPVGSRRLHKNVSGLSGEYVTISPSAMLSDVKNEAFIASKISCLEESGQENDQPGQGDIAIRLTPLIQEINTLTLTAQQEDLSLSGLRKKRSVKEEKAPPVPSRATRRRSSTNSNKARLQSPPENKVQRSRSTGTGCRQHEMETRSCSKSIRAVEEKFSRAVKETKIMRIQSERSAQRRNVPPNLQRRFSIQVRGISPSQRRINSNAARRKSHEMNRTSALSSGMSTPVTDLSRLGISRSPNRCTLKRGRPNTLRSGLARPSPASSRNTSKLNDSVSSNSNQMNRSASTTETKAPIAPIPMRRLSSVQDLVQKLEKKKSEKDLKKQDSTSSKMENSLKPVNRSSPSPPKRTLTRKNSSSSKFVKPSINTVVPKTPKGINNGSGKTKTPKSKSATPEGWVPASDFNFETQRTRFLKSLGGDHNDRDSIQQLKALNAGKVSENVRLFDGMSRSRKSPGKSLIPRYVALQRKESLKKL